MEEFVLKFLTFFALFGVTTAIQSSVQHLFLENELIIDLAARSSDELIITTDPNHIFYFSFLTNDDVDAQQISTSLTIVDVNLSDSLIFPSETNKLSPFYSTGNVVAIKFKASSSTLNTTMNTLRLKAEKAVSCPFNIGGSSTCGRVVDELSCYCALFSARTWENTKAYCQSYNMKFLSIESYEEDLAVFTAFGEREILWIGASDIASEGSFIWDSTGRKMSPGYMGWTPDHPLYNGCGGDTSDCAAYNIASAIPAWIDLSCTASYGGICELQPVRSARSIQPIKMDLENELIIDLSGSSGDLIIETEPNHIFYFSFITPGDDTFDEHKKELIRSSLVIMDVNNPDSLLFPTDTNQLTSFYSTGNTVSINFIKPISSLNGFQLRTQKAVSCPFSLGGSSSCGRIVDDISCYCALFASINWNNMRDFCKANNMNFVAIESYEEDLALYKAWGGFDTLWIGASDTASEGTWVWDSTLKKMSPGYQGWYPGLPYSSCVNSNYDCVAYRASGSSSTLPQWIDLPCSNNYGGGICELQPAVF